MSQVWAVNSLGGYMYSDELSAELRTALQPQMRWRQFCDAKDASKKAKSKGDLWHWDVYSNVATQGTTLNETNTLPETSFTITQGTLTVTEYGNSVPFTEKLDNLSKHSVKEVINKALKNDAAKALDLAAFNEFNKTPLCYWASSTATGTLTTNSTFGSVASNSLHKDNVQHIVDTMKERNIPAYTADDYYAIGWPTSFSLLRSSLDSVFAYTETGFQKIMRGEIGRYKGVRFVEQTAVPKATMGSYTNTGAVFFFGADTVMEGIVVPEEMRGKIPTDYGRSRGIAWYYLGGFGIVHNQATDTASCRIVKWGSTT